MNLFCSRPSLGTPRIDRGPSWTARSSGADLISIDDLGVFEPALPLTSDHVQHVCKDPLPFPSTPPSPLPLRSLFNEVSPDSFSCRVPLPSTFRLSRGSLIASDTLLSSTCSLSVSSPRLRVWEGRDVLLHCVVLCVGVSVLRTMSDRCQTLSKQ